MSFPILGTPKPQFLDSTGSPLVSGTISIYEPGTTTIKASYPTAADATALTNGTSGDITLDARGEPTSTQLWGVSSGQYKIVIKDSAGSTIYSLDSIRLPKGERQARITFAGGDATPSVAGSNIFLLVAGVTYTGFDDGEVGDTIILTSADGPHIITQSSTLRLSNEKDFTMQNGDTLALTMFGAGGWTETGRTYGQPRTKYKTADEALITTTLADDTHLFGWSLMPGTYYNITGYLFATSDGATQDLKIDFTTTQTHVADSYLFYSVDEDGATGAGATGKSAQAGTTSVTIDILSGKTIGIYIQGTILTHATLAPTVSLQVAQGTDAGTTTLKKGSWITIEQMGR